MRLMYKIMIWGIKTKVQNNETKFGKSNEI